jgi:diacylglycerol O-acyltransferase
VRRLDGADAMMLYSETPNIHMHTLKVAVMDAANFKGDYGFDLFRRMFEARLDQLELLRYQLVHTPLKLHHPMWLENVDVDLEYHVRRLRVPSPGGRRELDELIGTIASTPLDRSRPLWELHFVEGMADHRFAGIGKEPAKTRAQSERLMRGRPRRHCLVGRPAITYTRLASCLA